MHFYAFLFHLSINKIVLMRVKDREMPPFFTNMVSKHAIHAHRVSKLVLFLKTESSAQ